jgi:hypothetical protein
MALDFPNSPTVGQVFTVSGATWTWDGVKWTANGSPVVAIGDNRVINGDMRVDQRNSGASGIASGNYTVDRWLCGSSQANKLTVGQNYSTATNPLGFQYFFGVQATAASTIAAGDWFQFWQQIEADAIGDFMFGTANAQPVTLSFWACSSLTGTFSGAVLNYAATRTYPFSYSLPTANTWTKISITIPGDTGGTWVMKGNGGAISLIFDLGTGSTYRGPANAWASASYGGVTGAVSMAATLNAKWAVTGVKLEIGSVATPYNRQSLAKSLADCQRYFLSHPGAYLAGYNLAGAGIGVPTLFPATMRASPTITFGTVTYNNSNTVAANSTSPVGFSISVNSAGGSCNATAPFTASAEL